MPEAFLALSSLSYYIIFFYFCSYFHFNFSLAASPLVAPACRLAFGRPRHLTKACRERTSLSRLGTCSLPLSWSFQKFRFPSTKQRWPPKKYRLYLGRGSELLFLRTDRQNLFTLKLLPNVLDKTEHFTGRTSGPHPNIFSAPYPPKTVFVTLRRLSKIF